MNKEQKAWQDYKSKEKGGWDVDRQDYDSAPIATLILIILGVIIALLGLAIGVLSGMMEMGATQPTQAPTPTQAHYVRFLCYHNNGQMLPDMQATWQRENGQVIEDKTDAVGCVIIPADEVVGVQEVGRQVYHAIWKGNLPVCLNVFNGEITSGNLCPPTAPYGDARVNE